jgi:hypothetical protein
MSKNLFSVGLIGILFLMVSSTYLIMGYDDVDPEEGIGLSAKNDHEQPIRYAESIMNGDFDVYAKEWESGLLRGGVGRSATYPPLTGYIVLAPYLITRAAGSNQETVFALTYEPFIFLCVFGLFLAILLVHRYHQISALDIAIGAILLFGSSFYAVKNYKFEIAIPFFIVAGVLFLPRRKILSGVFFGLAICTKQIAVLAAIPVFFHLCAEKNYRQVAVWAIGAGVTILAVHFPFILGSGIDNIYVGQFKSFDLHPIQAHTTAGYLYKIIAKLFGDPDGRFNLLMQMNYNKLILVACIAFSFAFFNRRNLRSQEALYAAMAICCLSYVSLGKFYNVGTYELTGIFLFAIWAMVARDYALAIIVLVLHSFLLYQWPMALYKKELMLVLLISISVIMYKRTLVRMPEQRQVSLQVVS